MRQLLGVEARDEAVRLARLQRLAGLGHRQGAEVAEGVAPLGQRGAGRQHLLHQQIEVVEIGEEVGAEERRVDPQRRPLGHGGDHFEQTDLGGRVEAVARLGFERGGPRRQRRPGPGLGLRHQRFRGGRPGGRHRGHDPAGLVAVASQPGLMLGRPVAGERQMRMCIDEPRQHASAAGVELHHVAEPALQPPLRPDPRHLPVLDEHRPALDDPEIERPLPVAGHDLRRVAHEQPLGGAHPSSLWSMGIRMPRSRATAAASG